MVWDLDKELLVNSVPSPSDCSISALVGFTSNLFLVYISCHLHFFDLLSSFFTYIYLSFIVELQHLSFGGFYLKLVPVLH